MSEGRWKRHKLLDLPSRGCVHKVGLQAGFLALCGILIAQEFWGFLRMKMNGVHFIPLPVLTGVQLKMWTPVCSIC